MNKYVEMAYYLQELTAMIEKKNIAIENIDLGLVLNPIINIYASKFGVSNDYSTFFEMLIKNAWEQRNHVLIVQTLRYIARDLGRMESIEANQILQRYNYYSELGHYKNLVRNQGEENNKKSARFEGKGVIYSAITGGYDDVKEPNYISKGIDYILFTDNPNIISDKWKVCLIDNPEGLDNVRLARKIKIMGHDILQQYDYSIWVDGKLKIKGDLRQYVLQNRGNNGILCFNHYFNNCIYDEGKICLESGKDNPDVIQNQMERYKREGYPEQNGLIESGILVRDLNDMKVQETMKLWWNEVLNGSRRDQLSFNYACWKNGQKYDTSKLYIYVNEYVELFDHNM